MSSDSIPQERVAYLRFPLSDRIEHWLLFVSFSALAFTGLAQKFALVPVSQWFIGLLGGIEAVRIIHRIAATMMAIETVYHLAVAGYRIFVLRTKLSMLPGVQDLRAVLQWILYNLGLSQERPLEGRFTFGEKVEYWALIWGTIVMGLTGFILWNPILAAKLLPGEFIPAAKAAHSAEALLAAAAILIWHFYNVHLKLFNKSMFSGRLTEKELAHEHPLELAELKAGTAVRPVAPEALAARRRVYIPIAAVVSLLMVAGIGVFITFEDTALATIPPMEDVEIYAPLPPTPFPTPDTSALAEVEGNWYEGIAGLFQQHCGVCHNATLAEGGLDVTTLQTLFAGGENGRAVVPGDPERGTLFEIQIRGDHPGQFSGEELALIREWVKSGAPEK